MAAWQQPVSLRPRTLWREHVSQSLQISENTQYSALPISAPYTALDAEVYIVSHGARSLGETYSFVACVVKGLGH